MNGIHKQSVTALFQLDTWGFTKLEDRAIPCYLFYLSNVQTVSQVDLSFTLKSLLLNHFELLSTNNCWHFVVSVENVHFFLQMLDETFWNYLEPPYVTISETNISPFYNILGYAQNNFKWKRYIVASHKT